MWQILQQESDWWRKFWERGDCKAKDSKPTKKRKYKYRIIGEFKKIRPPTFDGEPKSKHKQNIALWAWVSISKYKITPVTWGLGCPFTT